MAQLTYHVAFPKLGILPDEILVLVEGKVKAIHGQVELPQKLKDSIEEVKKLLGRKTNKGNQQSDRRCSSANENFQGAGALSNQTDTPKKASSQNPDYTPTLASSFHEEQQKLFQQLKSEWKLNGAEPKEGYLVKNGKPLTHTDMCNILDEATKTFMAEDMPANSMSTGRDRGSEIREMRDSCNIVLACRLCLTETFGHDLLNKEDYEKWKTHVNIIASFGALMAVLISLLK